MANDRVKIRLPKDYMNNNKYMIVGVNGNLMKIPRNEEIEIPASYLEVINSCLDAAEQADIYVEKVQKASKKKKSDID